MKYTYEGAMNSDEILVGEQQYMDYGGKKVKIPMQKGQELLSVRSKFPGSVEGNMSVGANLACRIVEMLNKG
jgi:hypothetical protein